jgi:hypothetical protein
VWLATRNGVLPEALALWIVGQLAASDPALAALLTPEGRARLPQEEPVQRGGEEATGAVASTELVKALTDLLYALDCVDQRSEAAAAEVVSARWSLLDVLARTYPAIAALLTPVARVPLFAGIEVTPGIGKGQGVYVGEAR